MKKYDEKIIGLARRALDDQEAGQLSERAALNRGATRRALEERRDTDYRQDFSIDVDRILHAHAYTRYIDKTQVFYLVKNDHITGSACPTGFKDCAHHWALFEIE